MIHFTIVPNALKCIFAVLRCHTCPRLQRRGFQLMAGERCDHHRVASYPGRVNAMKQQSLRLAADNQN